MFSVTIPAHIGEHLMQEHAKGNTHHHIPGFTSTSTSRSTAVGFARSYNKQKASTRDGPIHVIQYHLAKGTGLSVAPHSSFPENEVMLHHGAHIEYHGHQVIRHKANPYSKGQEEIILHHVTVHPDHKKLEEYGSYDHPKED